MGIDETVKYIVWYPEHPSGVINRRKRFDDLKDAEDFVHNKKRYKIEKVTTETIELVWWND